MKERVKIIGREAVMNMLSSPAKPVLVDVLSREHYEQEHIKGAISLPVDEIKERAPVMFSKDDMIVVYCASFECQASTRAAELLQELGFKNVLDYKGGLKDYKEIHLPLEGSMHREAAHSV